MKMIKKIFLSVIVITIVMSMTACGTGNNNNNATVTLEQYQALTEGSDWTKMSPEEMEEYLGVKCVDDELGNKNLGEGYKSMIFPGPDEKSYLRVVFKDKGNGDWDTASISPSGELAK